MALKDIALSSGSARTSASLEPSYVLRALGTAEDMAHSSLRFGMGRFTTEAEVDYVIERIVAIVQPLQDMTRCGRWSRIASTSARLTGRSIERPSQSPGTLHPLRLGSLIESHTTISYPCAVNVLVYLSDVVPATKYLRCQ